MDSLPPPPLRLLPAGTTSCRVGISPTENPNLAQRTPRQGRQTALPGLLILLGYSRRDSAKLQG
jgi:hypothetical protein